MAWIARQHIDISYIKPLHDQNNVFSDKDTDEEIIRSAKQENPDIKAEKAYNQLVDIKNNTAEKGGSKTYLCPICQSVFEKLFNLKSHMIRKYKDAEKPQSGNCLYLQCGHKCRYIEYLRQHLIEKHNKVFHLENKSFENVTSINFFFVAKPQSETSLQVSADPPNCLLRSC